MDRNELGKAAEEYAKNKELTPTIEANIEAAKLVRAALSLGFINGAIYAESLTRPEATEPAHPAGWLGIGSNG